MWLEIIKILLIFFGWLVLIWNSNRIATRSDIRSSCNKVLEQLEGIKEKSSLLWNDREADELTADRSINGALSILELLTEEAKKHYGHTIIESRTIALLRDELPEGLSYENSKDFKDKKILEIDDNIYDAIVEVEKNYHQMFTKNGFWKASAGVFKKYSGFAGAATGFISIFFAYQVGRLLNFIRQ